MIGGSEGGSFSIIIVTPGRAPGTMIARCMHHVARSWVRCLALSGVVVVVVASGRGRRFIPYFCIGSVGRIP